MELKCYGVEGSIEVELSSIFSLVDQIGGMNKFKGRVQPILNMESKA